MNRETEIREFVERAIGEYAALTHEIILNDDSDEDYTDFEVIINNSTNEEKAHAILRCHDYSGGIEILKGEDFFACDEKDFVMDLFLSRFLTLQENRKIL